MKRRHSFGFIDIDILLPEPENNLSSQKKQNKMEVKSSNKIAEDYESLGQPNPWERS